MRQLLIRKITFPLPLCLFLCLCHSSAAVAKCTSGARKKFLRREGTFESAQRSVNEFISIRVYVNARERVFFTEAVTCGGPLSRTVR